MFFINTISGLLKNEKPSVFIAAQSPTIVGDFFISLTDNEFYYKLNSRFRTITLLSVKTNKALFLLKITEFRTIKLLFVKTNWIVFFFKKITRMIDD
jgi:hypothetical protein